MAKRDYYEILGVSKNDSDEVIKKNYKKLALKFHPDKASEGKKKEYEESFKEINEAYSILGNPEKRKRYDVGDSNPFGQQSNSRGRGGFSDIFEELLRGGSFGGGFSGGEDSYIDRDLHYQLTIEFSDSVYGSEKEISVRKDILCDLCGGTGAKDNKFENCSKCNGSGKIKISQRTPWGVINQVINCERCKGSGRIPKKKCERCNGVGILNKAEKIKVKIPKGIDNGQTLRIQGAGNVTSDGYSGDLFLTVLIKPHEIFKRDGFDVYMELPITFSQAALGDRVYVPTLYSEKVKIKIAKGTESGTVLRLKGEGIPFLNNPRHKGEQFIKILIKTPKKLSGAQIKLFKELKKLDK